MRYLYLLYPFVDSESDLDQVGVSQFWKNHVKSRVFISHSFRCFTFEGSCLFFPTFFTLRRVSRNYRKPRAIKIFRQFSSKKFLIKIDSDWIAKADAIRDFWIPFLVNPLFLGGLLFLLYSKTCFVCVHLEESTITIWLSIIVFPLSNLSRWIYKSMRYIAHWVQVYRRF